MALTGGSAWISDSTLQGGFIGGFTGYMCPVGSGQGRFSRCTFPAMPAFCSMSQPTTGPMLGVSQTTALQSPGPLTLAFQTDPNGLVGVFVSTNLAVTAVPGLEQPVLLGTTTLIPLSTLIADGVGAATGTWNVPPGLTNWTFFFQAVGTAPAPYLLQMSPVTGGVVR